MSRCSSLVRICIFGKLMGSLKRGLFSSPFFSAACDIASNRGYTAANWCFSWGVTLGARPFASRSNSAFVMTVLQSAAGVFDAVLSAPVLSGAVLADAAVVVWAGAGHTPLIVNTGASGGTDADLSAGAAGGSWAAAGLPGVWLAGAGGAAGGVCPQARVPSNTPTSQLLRINRFLQDCFVQTVRSLKHEILAHHAPVTAPGARMAGGAVWPSGPLSEASSRAKPFFRRSEGSRVHQLHPLQHRLKSGT